MSGTRCIVIEGRSRGQVAVAQRFLGARDPLRLLHGDHVRRREQLPERGRQPHCTAEGTGDPGTRSTNTEDGY